MADSRLLLQMLEPAVRPVPTQGTPGAAPKLPVEQQSFDMLLQQAQQAAGDEQPASDTAATGKQVSPLAPLQGLDRIENASLRSIVAKAASGSSPADDMTA